jgi:Ca2+-binding EF-hand superfamily protein
MFDDESRKLFDYLDKGKTGKLKYNDFTSCFECN